MYIMLYTCFLNFPRIPGEMILVRREVVMIAGVFVVISGFFSEFLRRSGVIAARK